MIGEMMAPRGLTANEEDFLIWIREHAQGTEPKKYRAQQIVDIVATLIEDWESHSAECHIRRPVRYRAVAMYALNIRKGS